MIVGVVVAALFGYGIPIAFLWAGRNFERRFERDAERAGFAPTPTRKAA